MAVFAKWDQIDGEFMDFDRRAGATGSYQEIEWTLYPGAGQLARIVRQSHPQGVNSILIGAKKVPGYHLTVGANGIIAILIGLLLPAVQAFSSASSSDRKQLTGVLAPGGRLGFVLGDGSVKFLSTTQVWGDPHVCTNKSSAGIWGDPHIELLRLPIVSPRDPASGQASGKRVF